MVTPLPDVNDVIAGLHGGLVRILGPHLVALYVTGSLAYGDFAPGSSDIDLFAVLGRRVDQVERARIEALHLSIEARQPTWAGRIETTYVPRDMLADVEPPREPRPYFNYGRMWKPDPAYGYEWLLQLEVVRRFGIALIGPQPARLIPEISAPRLREASVRDLRKEWEPALRDDSYLDTPHLLAYAVLTLCRVLYRQETGEFATKRAAATWTAERHPPWRHLVTGAMSWQHGWDFSSPEEVAGFIGYVLADTILGGS